MRFFLGTHTCPSGCPESRSPCSSRTAPSPSIPPSGRGASFVFVEGPPFMIVISHTLETGTVVYGTSRTDGTGQIIREEGFRPSRHLAEHEVYGEAVWYLASTRRRPAKKDYIDRCSTALKEAGFEVLVEIDNITPPTTTFAQLAQERYHPANH